MKHIEWVKERSLHSALDGKTPYEMYTKRLPHLRVSTSSAQQHMLRTLAISRTLDVCAQLGQFVGYDSGPMAIVFIGIQNGQYLLNGSCLQSWRCNSGCYCCIPSDLSEGERTKSSKSPRTILITVDENTVNDLSQKHFQSTSELWRPKYCTTPSAPEISDALPSNDMVEDPSKSPDWVEALFRRNPRELISRCITHYHLLSKMLHT